MYSIYWFTIYTEKSRKNKTYLTTEFGEQPVGKSIVSIISRRYLWDKKTKLLNDQS